MLEIKDLCFSYGSGEVLKDVSFNVPKGSLCGLMGPNGSGKSTLFKCCLNFLKPTSGTIAIGGRNVYNMKPSAMSKLVSYVPQEHKPPFPYTVREIVLMGRTPHMGGIFGLSKADEEAADKAMKLLDIEDLAETPCNKLSGGQRQLAFIARAAAQETPLMFLDEPTSALDFSNQIKIWKLLKKIASSGVTVIACSHDPNHVLWFSDETVAILNGKIETKGETSKVLDNKLLTKLYNDEYLIGTIGNNKIIYPGGI